MRNDENVSRLNVLVDILISVRDEENDERWKIYNDVSVIRHLFSTMMNVSVPIKFKLRASRKCNFIYMILEPSLPFNRLPAEHHKI